MLCSICPPLAVLRGITSASMLDSSILVLAILWMFGSMDSESMEVESREESSRIDGTLPSFSRRRKTVETHGQLGARVVLQWSSVAP